MSYGSETCPHCQGEVKVYVDGDGTASGWCPHCRKTMTFLPMKWKPRIPDEGAFYEVVVTEWIDDYQGIQNGMHYWVERKGSCKWEQSLAVYTNLEQARKRCAEIRAEAETASTETMRVFVSPSIKRWNHDRTDWEWWRPEWAEQEVSA